MTIFGKSRDLKTKTPKTQAACVFLSLHAGGWMVEKNGIRNAVAILNSRGQVWAG